MQLWNNNKDWRLIAGIEHLPQADFERVLLDQDENQRFWPYVFVSERYGYICITIYIKKKPSFYRSATSLALCILFRKI